MLVNISVFIFSRICGMHELRLKMNVSLYLPFSVPTCDISVKLMTPHVLCMLLNLCSETRMSSNILKVLMSHFMSLSTCLLCTSHGTGSPVRADVTDSTRHDTQSIPNHSGSCSCSQQLHWPQWIPLQRGRTNISIPSVHARRRGVAFRKVTQTTFGCFCLWKSSRIIINRLCYKRNLMCQTLSTHTGLLSPPSTHGLKRQPSIKKFLINESPGWTRNVLIQSVRGFSVWTFLFLLLLIFVSFVHELLKAKSVFLKKVWQPC